MTFLKNKEIPLFFAIALFLILIALTIVTQVFFNISNNKLLRVKKNLISQIEGENNRLSELESKFEKEFSIENSSALIKKHRYSQVRDEKIPVIYFQNPIPENRKKR